MRMPITDFNLIETNKGQSRGVCLLDKKVIWGKFTQVDIYQMIL